jgi:hypothetical protein
LAKCYLKEKGERYIQNKPEIKFFNRLKHTDTFVSENYINLDSTEIKIAYVKGSK